MPHRNPITTTKCTPVAAALAAMSVAAFAAPAQGATFTVDNVNDAGAGSFRQAIIDANALAGADRIEFTIPGAPAVPQVIAPVNDLDTITGKVTIDGYTQPGSAQAQPGVLSPAEIRVVLDATLTNRGLEFTTNGSLVRGLQITNANLGVGVADGITVTGNGNRFEGNHIGTDGTLGLGNDDAGVEITGNNNVVGGSTPATRNVISDNEDGVRVELGTGNAIQGNYIGTDETGTLGLGNSWDGIGLAGPGNLVGGRAAGEGNLVSDNTTGVRIKSSDGTGNRIQGNLVGTDVTGTQDLGNSSDGIEVEAGSAGTLIGGAPTGAGNVIGGNDSGVVLHGDANRVVGNRIGTTLAGDVALPNDIGVEINGGDGNTIGGRTTRKANVISGNGGPGVFMTDDLAFDPATSNRVEGNRIGTNLAGTLALPNEGDGVEIFDSNFNTIGGLKPGAGNLISGNRDNGIEVKAIGQTAAGNRIVGNVIGLDSPGTTALPNGQDGINFFAADSNTVGGLKPRAANVIAANGEDGIELDDADINSVLGNAIGTDATHTLDFGNGGSGVRIDGDLNRVGDEHGVGPPNTVAVNDEDGVTVENGVGNRISHNAIRDNGELGIDLEGDDVTDNDPLVQDGDSGANDRQNFPVLTAATPFVEQTPGPNGLPVFTVRSRVTWTLDSTASRTFLVDFYSNATCDPSQNGEGEVYLGSSFATTDAAGLAAGTATVAFAPQGQSVTATATSLALAPIGPDAIGFPSSDSHTSEFSTCQVIG